MPAAIAAEAARAAGVDPETDPPATCPTSALVERFAERPRAEGRHDGRAAWRASPTCRPPCGRYLAAHRPAAGPPRCSRPPSWRALDWAASNCTRRPAPDEAVGVGVARWGIAETGSLVFHSGADTPILANFLPLHHIVAAARAAILAYLEDYAAAAATATPPPRNAIIITGASGTTDIEGTYVRGAHGPGYLHVVLLEAG